MIIDTPPNMAEGNWTVGLIIDDSASDVQADALGQVMSGTNGGPPEALGPLLGNFLGVERLPISIVEEDGKHHETVGDTVAYTGRPELNEDGEAVQLTGLNTHPASNILTLAPVESVTASAMGIEYSGKNLSGFITDFNWAN